MEVRKIIPAKSLDKEFRKLVQEKWALEARGKNKPLCETCAREDQKKGQFVKNIDKYLIEGKPERITKIFDRKDSTRQIGEFREYHCPNNHGNSYEVVFPKKTVEIATLNIEEKEAEK